MAKTNSSQKITKYKHLNIHKRQRLANYLSKGLSLRQAAYLLDISPSTVSREVKRGRAAAIGGNYSSTKAHRQTRLKRHWANQQHRKLYLGSDLEALVRYYLKQYYSPEQIAGAAQLNLSKDTIYRWLRHLDTAELQDLRPYLRHKAKRRKWGTKERLRLGRQVGKRPLSERPPIIAQRLQMGHWEGDTIVGKNRKTRFITLVERVSGYLLVIYVPSADKETFATNCIRLFKQVKAAGRLSLTLDNGSEMNDFARIEKASKTTIYFADPYASYQRGTNENTNGLIRQFFPKGTDFSQITRAELAKAAHLINNRPRKRHGFKSPATVFKEHLKR